MQKPPQKQPLMVMNECTHPECRFCAYQFFHGWYKQRMGQMNAPKKGETISFSEAAATSVRPPKDVPANVEPGTRVQIVRGVQANTHWGKNGVVEENRSMGYDGIHRLYIRFRSQYSGAEWVWAVNRLDLALV